jgi:hypothetical protein
MKSEFIGFGKWIPAFAGMERRKTNNDLLTGRLCYNKLASQFQQE